MAWLKASDLPDSDSLRSMGCGAAAALAERLIAALRHHDRRYYVLDDPEISDEAYDSLFQALRILEEQLPDLVRDDSPTQRVGAEPLTTFPTARHASPMLSLQATREAREVERFRERVAKAASGPVVFLMEPKLDGASLELVYEEGMLVRAVTRGDGRRGEVVTENARTVHSIPLRLDGKKRAAPAALSVRGEIVMLIPDFHRLNERLLELGEKPFANPRNAAAGSLRQLDSRVTAHRPLHLIVYEIMNGSELAFQRDSDVIEALQAWGLRTPEDSEVGSGRKAILRYHRRWADRRDRLDYEIDGVVAKVDDLDTRRTMGATAAHPRWAIACKFEPRREVARVEGITVSVGQSGRLTPVALLRPVEVAGGHRVPGLAPQPGGGEAQGHPEGRRRPCAAGR